MVPGFQPDQNCLYFLWRLRAQWQTGGSEVWGTKLNTDGVIISYTHYITTHDVVCFYCGQ